MNPNQNEAGSQAVQRLFVLFLAVLPTLGFAESLDDRISHLGATV